MKKWIIISFVLGFVLLNSGNLYDFLLNAKGNYYFAHSDFESAKSYYNRSSSLAAYYNGANADYKEKKYDQALKQYQGLVNGKKEVFQAYLLYNIGNTYYKLSLGNLSQQQQYLEKSVQSYTKSLDIYYSDYTKANLDFVLGKLHQGKHTVNQSKTSQNNQKNSQSGTGTSQNTSTQSGSGSQKTGEQNKTQADGGKNGEKSGSGGQANVSKNGDNHTQSNTKTSNQNSLSPEIQNQLKAYQESLRQDQKQNQQALGKVYDEQNTNDPFDNFFSGDPFFDNGLLQKNDTKKDW